MSSAMVFLLPRPPHAASAADPTGAAFIATRAQQAQHGRNTGKCRASTRRLKLTSGLETRSGNVPDMRQAGPPQAPMSAFLLYKGH